MTDDPQLGQEPTTDDPVPSEPTPASASSPEPTPETFDAAYVAKLRTENADWRKKTRALEATTTELQAKVKQFEDARLSDDERKQKQHEELASKAAESERRASELEARLQETRVRAAIERAAGRTVTNDKGAVTRPAFTDPSDAYPFLDLAALEFNDAGEPTNVEALLAQVAQAKPHLLRTEPKPTTGATTNPARSQASEPKEDDNARYQRLYGFNPSTIFDPATAAQRGGGVRWSKPPE